MTLSIRNAALTAELIGLHADGLLGSPRWREVAAQLTEDPTYRWACPLPGQVRLADETAEDLVGQALVDPDDGEPFVVAAALIDQTDVSFIVDTRGVLREFGPWTVLEEPAPCLWKLIAADVAVELDVE